METEPLQSESVEKKAEALESLILGPLTSSASRLLNRSRGIPSGKDFHFYNNFDEFKLPAREIAAKAESSLGGIASSTSLWGSKKPPRLPDEVDEAYDWLVNLNDDFLEKFGVYLDDFRSFREKQEQNSVVMDSGDGFQLVCGKKKRRGILQNQERAAGYSDSLGIKMISRDKRTAAARAKVPFHLPNIPRPQKVFNILVNNKNTPFEHVWLERSVDMSRFMHPLEKLSVLDFIDRNIVEDEIIKPLSLESTPFKLVEGVKELKELAAKLYEANEFAVDLEHNQYRSFLGLTCLMQISTRTEDFILDTLKLRIHIGPHLREVFKDPSKRKIMHGAYRDILWLQRDFGIYVCNLFDTGQGSRLLQLERNSLEYLLLQFCDVEANKEYQNAEWRLRPLPDEMIKYAREDTHYLLHIYDLMRCRLISSSSDDNDLLLEVYKRSSEVCMQLYEKELFTDTSYLHIYGLAEMDFDSKQLAIVAGLCEWRDNVAREEDESTGYILPNKAVLEIAREMPQSSGKLRRLVKSKHYYVERHLNAVSTIIKNSIANSSAFECVAEKIRNERLEASAMLISEAEKSKSVSPLKKHATECDTVTEVEDDNNKLSVLEISCSSSSCDTVGTAAVEVMKKPSCSFGALFGKSSSKRKTKALNESKVEQINASVILPFYSFSGDEVCESSSPAENVVLCRQSTQRSSHEEEQQSCSTRMEDILRFENSSSRDGSESSPPPVVDDHKSEMQMSLSDLSSQLQSNNMRLHKPPPEEVVVMLPQRTPFDYATATKTLKFGEENVSEKDANMIDGGALLLPHFRDAKKSTFISPSSSINGEAAARERGQQGRRRHAFPSSGNRSTTYRC